MTKPLVVVDADTMLFSAASVSETKSIEVTNSKGITKAFKNRTAFKDFMKSKGWPITEEHKITDKQEAEPTEHCLQIVKQGAEAFYSTYSDCEIVFVAGDRDNFRLDLPLPTRYKSNRADTLRPINLAAAHSYLKGKYKSKQAVGTEADALCIILANEGLAQGREVILLSEDKDSRQCIGVKLGKYRTPRSELVLVPEYSEIELIKGEPKSYGIPWLAVQMCYGDFVDGYKPTDLTNPKIKYGAMSVYKDLVGSKTPQEALLKVIAKYKEWYPDKFSYKAWDGVEYEVDWKDILRMYYKCVKMEAYKNDPLIADELFGQYGIDL